jgi:ATP-binding cassette subfamily B multidrug efflux pump
MRRDAASQVGGGGGGVLSTDGAPVAAGTLLRIIRLALKHPWRVVTAFLTTIIAANFQLLIPQFLGQAVDHAHGLLVGGGASVDEAQAALLAAALMLLGASVLRGIFTMLHNYIGESVGHMIGYGLRLAYYEKLQRLSFGFYDRVHTGDLITRGLLDLEGVRMFFSAGLVRLVLLANLIGIGSALVISSDTVLGLLSLSFVPFVAWRSSVARLKLRRMWRLLQERLSELSLVMDENMGGIRVVRAFAAQGYEMGKFDTASDRALDMANQRIGVRVRNTTAMTFAYFIAMGLVLWFGGLKVIDGQISVGKLAEFLAFMTILQMPVRQLGMMVNAFARASTCGARLFEVLDLVPTIRDAPDAPDLKVKEGVLRFEDVDFAYRDAASDERVLRGVNFEVGPGRVLGIVGPPGSGKSTIAHLIPRFYDIGGGRITIDGQDIRDVTLESLRRVVGVVQQDTFMFTASIENNVAYGDPWADGERIARANRAAQLHDYVSRLPAGYESLVGERGVSLSGGQRQRLSIARSIMLNPSFLVFDDSTAAIDAATEQRIRAALKDSTRPRYHHHLAPVELADAR